MTLETKLYCVKRSRVRNICGSYFPSFGLNTDQKNSKNGQFSRSVNLRSNFQNYINPLQPCVAFLYPLKTSENLKVF